MFIKGIFQYNSIFQHTFYFNKQFFILSLGIGGPVTLMKEAPMIEDGNATQQLFVSFISLD